MTSETIRTEETRPVTVTRITEERKDEGSGGGTLLVVLVVLALLFGAGRGGFGFRGGYYHGGHFRVPVVHGWHR